MPPPMQFGVTPEWEAGKTSFLYRQLFEKAQPPDPNQTNLKGKVIIVTGSNTGLGLSTSHQLLDLGLSKLILAVRNVEKGKTAAKALSKGREPGDCDIDVWELDLSSYDSIVEFAKRAETLQRLDVAILNAAAVWAEEKFNSKTGFEENIQTNYLGNALLACLLLPTLKKKREPSSPPGRIVFVSSDTAAWARYEEKQSASGPGANVLQTFKKSHSSYEITQRYATSKLLGQLFVAKLSQEVSASVVTVNLANPGLCRGSEIHRAGVGSLRDLFFATMKYLIGYSADVGSRSITHAAVSFGGKSHGQYIGSGKLRPMAALVYQPEGERLAELLWDETMEEFAFANVRRVLEEVKA